MIITFALLITIFFVPYIVAAYVTQKAKKFANAWPWQVTLYVFILSFCYYVHWIIGYRTAVRFGSLHDPETWGFGLPIFGLSYIIWIILGIRKLHRLRNIS